MSNDVVFRRIGGRIVPIKKKIGEVKDANTVIKKTSRKDIPALLSVGAGFGVSAGGGYYAGKLINGDEFDNSFKRGQPIDIPIGVGQVIKGWDEGILLLKEGETATLLIPPALGYGERGAGGVIPPNAWLVFDVELVKISK